MRKTTFSSPLALAIFLAISALLIEISPANAQIVFERGVITRGRIVGPDGRGVADAWILVSESPWPGPMVTFTFTETDGSFSFTTQEGTFVIQITAPPGSGAASAFVTAVRLPSAEDLLIELDQGFDLTGRVVDESGNPLEDINIGAYPQGDRGFVNAGFTESDGSFGVSLRPGTYDVIIGISGELPEGLAETRISGVEVTSDTDLGDIVPRRREAIGTVLDSSERPVTGLRVFLIQDFRTVEGGEDTTDEDGRFGFGVEPGVYDIHVQAPPGSGVGSTARRNVQLPPEEELIITLEPGFTVEGTLLGPDGNPLRDVVVDVTDSRSRLRLVQFNTEADGRFGISLASGTYDFQFGPFGLPEGLLPVTLRNVEVAQDIADLFSAAAGAPPAPRAPERVALELSINPRQARLTSIPSTVQLEADITYSDGTSQDVTASAQWSSSNTSVATVTASGLVIARGNGTSTITAASGELSGTMALTVAQAVPVRGIVRVRPQMLAAGFDPTLVDLNDSSFDIIALVRPGAVPINTVTITQNQGSFSISMSLDVTLPNGDQLYRTTFNFPRGSITQTTMRAVWGDRPGEFNITVIDRAQQRHSFPDLEFGNNPDVEASVASPPAVSEAARTIRLRPQVLAAGFDPTQVDFDDSSFDIIAIVRPGAVPIGSVTVTQNQGTFSISMDPAEELPNGDLLFRKTFNFRRGSFGEQVFRALWGDEPGEFNITVIDVAQSRHSFPDLEFGNQPSIN